MHYDLKFLPAGSVIVVSLDHGANLHLMDDSNFRRYRSGQQARTAFSGIPRETPFRLSVPHAGTWHLVATMAGLRGSARIGVRVLKPSGV
ncbi:DUF1883 domain-containing protein [Amycolatopsis japonica]|uniref:DUF1883 domain-containing protein n=1 Tax=Amycolatopsis japonica TaxID=208439 RepID=UPI003400801B